MLVAGSLGPTGQLCEPLGTLTHDEAADAYAEQAEALAEGGADLLVLETMFCQIEAGAAIDGVRRATDLPFVLAFSFDRGTRTMMGTTTAEVVALARRAGRGRGRRQLRHEPRGRCRRSSRELSAAAPGPAAVGQAERRPAAHDRRLGRLRRHARTTSRRPRAATSRPGARVVGGCCGSTPEHVRAIAEAIRRP